MGLSLKPASPWWLSLAYGGGLLLLFLGQRAFKTESIAPIATALGALLVIGVTAWRVFVTFKARGGRRRVERAILWCHLGAALALLVYALTTNFGMKLLGLDDLSEAGADKYRTVMLVLWTIILFVSLLPLMMIEFTQLDYALRAQSRRDVSGKMSAEDRAKFDATEEDVEHVRVRQAGWAGLSIALAAAFLLVTCQVAAQKNVRRDVSYFKTATPGESTRNIAKNSKEKYKVLLFFPAVNDVKNEVRGYFDSLADTGKFEIQEDDFMANPKLAARYGIGKHGTVLIAKGDLMLDDPDTKKKAQSEKIELGTDLEKERRSKTSKLRNLDREVNTVLLKLAREKRKAYISVGHGELNDYESVAPDNRAKVPERRTTALKRRLGDLNYEVKELGLVDLTQDVPEDATVVIVLAPSTPFTPQEMAALDRYVAKGGRLLIALDPRGDGGGLGPLEGRLGVKFNKASITDDKYMYRQLGTPADRRWAVTTQFSAHASTTTLSRSVDKGLLMVDSGALEDAPFTHDADKTKRTYVIRSMTNSWLDLDDDLEFRDGVEKRDRYNVGAAIEGPKVKGADGAEKDGFRALVFADADLFADLTAVNLGNYAVLTVGPVPSGYMSQPLGLTSGPLLEDAIKWLGGEEVLAGEVVTEEDQPIKHTQDKDTAWFFAMIGGAPLLVLGFGGWFVTRRKRRSRRKAAKAAAATAKPTEVTK